MSEIEKALMADEIHELQGQRMVRMKRRLEDEIRKWTREEFGVEAEIETTLDFHHDSFVTDVHVYKGEGDEIDYKSEHHFRMLVTRLEINERFEAAPTLL